MLRLVANGTDLDTDALDRASSTCHSKHSVRVRFDSPIASTHHSRRNDESALQSGPSSLRISESKLLSATTRAQDQEIIDYYDEAGVDARRVASEQLLRRCNVFQFGLRKPSALVHWESPLIAAQRAEGLFMAYRSGHADEAMIWRVSPVDLQVAVVAVISLALETGAPLASQATITSPGSNAAAASPNPDPVIIASAAAEWKQYSSATASLAAQRDRVAGGGEPWTRMEKLQRLAKLQSIVDGIGHKLAHSLEAHDHAAHGPSHGHHHHHHPTRESAYALALSMLTESERSILDAYDAGRADLDDESGGAVV